MNRKFTITLTLLALIASSYTQLAGGFTQHSINQEARTSALSVIQETKDAQNGKLTSFINADKKLVFYGTQVVAGINYGMVY